jgi:septal ring factor EnvC (AmiA/AmiB activator)
VATRGPRILALTARDEPRRHPERVDNTLEILASLQGNEPHALRRALALSAETLKEVRTYLKEIEAELDVLTTPGRRPAEELVHLQKELAQATDRVNVLERQLASEKQARRVDEQLREADKKRLAEFGAADLPVRSDAPEGRCRVLQVPGPRDGL